MPPATIASVITSTRKTLRTDHSMRRPSMPVPLVAGGGGRSLLRAGWPGMTSVRVGGAIARLGYWFLAGARGCVASGVTLTALVCRLHVSFRVDQVVGGDPPLFSTRQ